MFGAGSDTVSDYTLRFIKYRLFICGTSLRQLSASSLWLQLVFLKHNERFKISLTLLWDAREVRYIMLPLEILIANIDPLLSPVVCRHG